ncbi:MAG: hypothetical protein WKF84_24690 [Pyrinomonadaceae bacterium]
MSCATARCWLSGAGINRRLFWTSANAFSVLADRLERYAVSSGIDSARPISKHFQPGACIATLAYDLVHNIERLRVKSTFNRNEPDAVFAFYDTLVVHDYVLGKTEVVGSSSRADEVAAMLLSASTASSVVLETVTYPDAALAISNYSRDAYTAVVQQIKEHIFAGDIYQANLTQQFTCSLPEDPAERDFRAAWSRSSGSFCRLHCAARRHRGERLSRAFPARSCRG